MHGLPTMIIKVQRLSFINSGPGEFVLAPMPAMKKGGDLFVLDRRKATSLQ